jgi:UDP-N-acetylglucosamine--N-acetylmuramyl-(pentapeptide) pyrophosphoryl-undecaprenol N-acetylglucosamine transferase
MMAQDSDLRIIIAGGGTGGHIFPAIAIANALKQLHPSTEILFVGAKGRMEMEKVPEAGYSIEGIDIAGFNRSSLIKNFSLPFKLLASFLQVRRIFASFRPDAVIGVGGYSSFPVLKYAQRKAIPSFIHESNAFAGKANKMLGKNASLIFTATDGMERFFPSEKISVTGNPVRRSIAGSSLSREEGIRHFGLDPARKTILVTGGSLGAKGINEAIAAGINQIADAGLQLIWQTGKSFAEQARQLCDNNPLLQSSAFIPQMEYAFAAADVVVSRSGAMAIAELCIAGKAVIFVPFPYAAEDHQTVNAGNLVNRGAALMLADAEAKDKLVNMILDLVNDEAKQREMRDAIGKLALHNADVKIAQQILDKLGIDYRVK